MIVTNRKITIGMDKSTIDEPVVLYRGDYEVEIRFTLDDVKFDFYNEPDYIKIKNPRYAQLVILRPNADGIFSKITECEDGVISFILTGEMIDQINEVGKYTFQIRLYDETKTSRVTIPPVEDGIDIREPVTSEDRTNIVNQATVDYSVSRDMNLNNDPVIPTFDSRGNYNATNWKSGDRITNNKLNKMEDAIYKINQNGNTNRDNLSNLISSNFNILDSKKIDSMDLESKIWSMKNMGQDIKEAISGGSVAVVGKNAILEDNIVDKQVSSFKLMSGNMISNINFSELHLVSGTTSIYISPYRLTKGIVSIKVKAKVGNSTIYLLQKNNNIFKVIDKKKISFVEGINILEDIFTAEYENLYIGIKSDNGFYYTNISGDGFYEIDYLNDNTSEYKYHDNTHLNINIGIGITCRDANIMNIIKNVKDRIDDINTNINSITDSNIVDSQISSAKLASSNILNIVDFDKAVHVSGKTSIYIQPFELPRGMISINIKCEPGHLYLYLLKKNSNNSFSIVDTLEVDVFNIYNTLEDIFLINEDDLYIGIKSTNGVYYTGYNKVQLQENSTLEMADTFVSISSIYIPNIKIPIDGIGKITVNANGEFILYIMEKVSDTQFKVKHKQMYTGNGIQQFDIDYYLREGYYIGLIGNVKYINEGGNIGFYEIKDASLSNTFDINSVIDSDYQFIDPNGQNFNFLFGFTLTVSGGIGFYEITNVTDDDILSYKDYRDLTYNLGIKVISKYSKILESTDIIVDEKINEILTYNHEQIQNMSAVESGDTVVNINSIYIPNKPIKSKGRGSITVNSNGEFKVYVFEKLSNNTFKLKYKQSYNGVGINKYAINYTLEKGDYIGLHGNVKYINKGGEGGFYEITNVDNIDIGSTNNIDIDHTYYGTPGYYFLFSYEVIIDNISFNKQIDMSNVDLTDVDISKANWDNVDISKANWDNVDLSNSKLNGSVKLTDFIIPRYSEIKEQVGFIGRWFDSIIGGVNCKCTINAGSELYFKVKGATRVDVNFKINSAKETPYFAYSIDGGDFIRQLITSPTLQTLSTDEHIIRIIIDGLTETEDKWNGEKGIAFKDITVDSGTVTGILPRNRKIMFFGDSITEGVRALNMSATADGNSSLHAYPFECCSRLNSVSYRVGFGATGICNPYGSGGIPNCLKYIDNMTNSRETPYYEPDIIVINHGTNDSGFGSDAFIPAYNKVLDRLSIKYPGVPIFTMIPFIQTHASDIRTCVKDRSNCYLVETEGWGVTYTDTCHPNANGAIIGGAKLAEKIIEVLGKNFFI